MIDLLLLLGYRRNDQTSQHGKYRWPRCQRQITALSDRLRTLKYWEIIADKLSAAGFSWDYCSAATPYGWCWIVDAYKNDGRRYIVESDEPLSASLELERTLL